MAGGDLWILLIGLFKVAHWVETFRIDPDNRYIHHVLSRVLRVTPRQLAELSAGSFVYAGLFLTEGVGLLTHKHWAEYLTIVSTALFIPLEIYELADRFTLIRFAVMVINLGIVWYLAVRVKRERRD